MEQRQHCRHGSRERGYVWGGWDGGSGVELAIPLGALGPPTQAVRVLAFLASADSSIVSSQFLPGLGFSGSGTISEVGEPRGQNLGAHGGAVAPNWVHSFMIPNAPRRADDGELKLLVTRIGVGDESLDGSAARVFIDEFHSATPDQSTPIQSFEVTDAPSGGVRLTTSGVADYEGGTTLSPDRRSLVLAGYDATPGTPSVASAHSAVVARVVAALGGPTPGAATLVRQFSGVGASAVRGAAMYEAPGAWLAGSSSGIHRRDAPGSGASTQVLATPPNVRGLGAFGNQLYFVSSATGFIGVNRLGTGMPVGTGVTASRLPGMADTTSPSSRDFHFADSATLYVADDSTGSAGGIQRWDRSGGTWARSYVLAAGSGAGTRAITGYRAHCGEPLLFAITTDNRLVRLIDRGPSSLAVTLATAPLNTAFRSVELSIWNSPPRVDVPGSPFTTPEGSVHTFVAVGADAFNTPSGLSYALFGAPTGSSIDPATGVFTWPPMEADGPGTFRFAVVATNLEGRTASAPVTIHVAEVNQPPSVEVAGSPFSVPELVPLTFMANASDPDLPAQTLTFALIGAPEGASIDPTTGAFAWTPAEAQGPDSYAFDVTVTDGQAVATTHVTIHVAEVSLILSGTVAIDAFTGDYSIRTVTLEVRLVGQTAALHVYFVPLNPDGSFAYEVADGLVAGVYDLAAKTPNSLRRVLSSVTMGPAGASGISFPLANGDAAQPGDNYVDIDDFLAMAAAYETLDGDPRFDTFADLTGDGAVDIDDFLEMAASYETRGDP